MLRWWFVSFRGRLRRSGFWLAGAGLALVFSLLFALTESRVGRGATLVLYPPFYWAAFALLTKRLHDRGHSPARLLLLLVPILGPLWLLVELGLLRALPSLARQKHEMVRQTLEILGGRRHVAGYVEIGTTGRYVGALRKELALDGEVVLVNDVVPGFSPADIVERGGLAKVGRFVPLDYGPIDAAAVPDGSADLVT